MSDAEIQVRCRNGYYGKEYAAQVCELTLVKGGVARTKSGCACGNGEASLVKLMRNSMLSGVAQDELPRTLAGSVSLFLNLFDN